MMGVTRSFTVSGSQAPSLTVLPCPSHDPEWLLEFQPSHPDSIQQEWRRAERQKGLLVNSVPLSRLLKSHEAIVFYVSLTVQRLCPLGECLLPGRLKCIEFFFFLPQCIQLDIWVLFIVKEGWNGCWGEQSGASASQLFQSSNRKVASGAISGLWYNHAKWRLRNFCSTCGLGLKLLPLITVIFCVTIFQVYVLCVKYFSYILCNSHGTIC